MADGFAHFTVEQLKSAGITQPVIEAILAARKVAAEQNPLNVKNTSTPWLPFSRSHPA